MGEMASTAPLLPHAGEGIVLRRLAPADLAAFQAYRHDPLLGVYQGWTATSDAEALAFLDRMSHAEMFERGDWSQVGIVEAGSAELIGDIGVLLADDGESAEIGFTLRRESQGRGLATAAVREVIALLFAHTTARRVFGITDARNLRSIRLLERVGMRRVATRDTAFRGEACTEVIHVVSRQRAGGGVQRGLARATSVNLA